MKIKIDGEEFTVEKVVPLGHLTMEDGTEYVVFADAEEAGKAAREYWADMAANDAEEFACMVGKETLISWALGQSAGPGSTQVRSLNEWLDLWLDTPEEHFAGYDGTECEVSEPDEELVSSLGFVPTVAYRTN